MGKPAKDAMAALGIPEAELTPRVREVIAGLSSEIAHLRARLESLETVADRDSLLPILNRRAFVREMSRVMAFGERYDLTTSLVYFDLNDLKTINDSDGHAAGDAALRHVAAVLAANIRKSDVLGRLGGDEFGVILPDCDLAPARRLAERLRHAVEEHRFARVGKLSCSAGVASTPRDGLDATELLAAAEQALGLAKKAGRHRTAANGPAHTH